MDHDMARRPEAWLIAVAGIAWFAVGAEAGLAGVLAATVPGALLLTAAVGSLLFPGSRQVPRAGAMGAFAGMIIAIPVLLFAPLSALLLFALSAGAAVCAGRLAADDLALPEEPPVPDLTLQLAAEISFDEAVIGGLAVMIGVFNDSSQMRVGEELEELLDWLRAGGWLNEPASFHEMPPPMGPVSVADARIAGLDCEVARFESEFEPRLGAPGRERWLGYAKNRQVEVRLVRAQRSREWLICPHGLGMGRSWLDLRVMGATWMHRRGVNLAFPVLPLHGPRAIGLSSGAGFLTGDVSNSLHALTQTAWDLRRLIAWLRDEGAERIALVGMSLGGYTTALVASLEAELDCAIAGMPPTEFGELTCYHASPRALALAEEAQITPERISAALTPVTPLMLEPLVPKDRRFIYAAMADRFVPPHQVEALWRHWDRPEILWFPGSHLGFRFHTSVRDFVNRALDTTLLRPR
jgi:hypothetical protein